MSERIPVTEISPDQVVDQTSFDKWYLQELAKANNAEEFNAIINERAWEYKSTLSPAFFLGVIGSTARITAAEIKKSFKKE